jgi:hypothetical protein
MVFGIETNKKNMNIEQTPVFHRQLDIISPTEMTDITLIGAGAIGSAVGLMLSKLGVSDVMIYDHDTIENHNLPNQLYSRELLGSNKATALELVMRENSPIMDDTLRFSNRPEKWENTEEQAEPSAVSSVYIVAVDDMATRRAIYQALKTKFSVQLMVDTRMSAENMRIYAGRPADPDFQEFYERTLYTDEEADDLPCTARSVIYNVFVIAGLVGSVLKKHWKKQKPPKEIIMDLSGLTFYHS